MDACEKKTIYTFFRFLFRLLLTISSIGSIFLSTLAPRYLRSMYIAIGLTALGIMLAVLQLVVYGRINAKRDKLVAEGAPDMPELGDANPHFRYWI